MLTHTNTIPLVNVCSHTLIQSQKTTDGSAKHKAPHPCFISGDHHRCLKTVIRLESGSHTLIQSHWKRGECTLIPTLWYCRSFSWHHRCCPRSSGDVGERTLFHNLRYCQSVFRTPPLLSHMGCHTWARSDKLNCYPTRGNARSPPYLVVVPILLQTPAHGLQPVLQQQRLHVLLQYASAPSQRRSRRKRHLSGKRERRHGGRAGSQARGSVRGSTRRY